MTATNENIALVYETESDIFQFQTSFDIQSVADYKTPSQWSKQILT